MKKFLLLMLVVWTGIASSCKYDDDELWGGVDDLANRISAMEALTKQMNGDIAAIQAIVTALENQESVSEVEKLTDGYILHFTNGKTATIKNGADGKDGEDGKDAPVIGIGQEEGVYYWTLTVDGKTEWLKDEAGNKLPVSDCEGGQDGADGSTGAAGADGKTPTLMVDKDGYWQVSYDGENYKPIENEAGEKVSALGASEGEPFFKEVKESDDQETITIVMNDEENKEYVLPLLKAIRFFTDSERTIPADIKNIPWTGAADEKMVFYYDLNLDEPSCEVVDEPNVGIEVNKENKSVTVSLKGNVVEDARAVVLFFNKTRTLTAVFKFVVSPWNGKAYEPIYKEQEKVYEIATPHHLAWIAKQVNDAGKSFEGKTIKLIHDIDLAGHDWTPIGWYSDKPFSGTFDGNGKTIKGLSVGNSVVVPVGRGSRAADETKVKGAGLFGVVKGATLKSVTITDAVIKAPDAVGAGVLVGYALDKVTIESVTITKEAPKTPSEETPEADVEGSQNVGSIAGLISASEVKIEKCNVKSISLEVTATENESAEETASVGGVVGSLQVKEGTEPKVQISDCAVEGIDLSAASKSEGSAVSSSAGGVVGSLKVDESVSTSVKDIISVNNNTVTQTQVVGTPSEEADNVTSTQGAVVGNLADLDATLSADIILNNEVSEEVEIETQLTVKNLEEVLKKTLKDSGISTFEVKGDITEKTTLTIPAEGVDVTLNFDDLATASGKVLTICQGTGTTAAESTHKLHINMPATDAGQYLDIRTPETTVVLESGYFAKVTALVAKNTIVVEQGVTVETLSVVDGSVQVFGHVINLVRAPESTVQSIAVTIEKGGKVDNMPEEGFEVDDLNVVQDFKAEKDGSYTIYTVAGWKTFVSMIDAGDTFAGKTVRLGADIDFNNELQTPVGVQEELDLSKIWFDGTLDGQGHSIKNLKIDNSSGRFTGLFAYVQGATFMNLRFVGGEVKATGNMYVGALLGYGRGVTVINCHNEGCKIVQKHEQNSGYAGGITGALTVSTDGSKHSYLIACTNSAEVSGAYCPSGITGGAWNGYVHVVACANTGKISYSGTQLGQANIYAAGISGALGGANNWMYGCFTDCEVVAGQGHSALVSDAGSSFSNFHYSYSANTDMSLLAAWGAPFSSGNKTLGYSSYDDAVDNLNKGIQMYNWTGDVPCTYKFVKGEKPRLVYAEPTTNPGGGSNNFGNGGKF